MKLIKCSALVSELLTAFRKEERRLLTFDRFNKYAQDVRARKDIVGAVLAETEPLDAGGIVLVLKQLGPVGGPELGMVTLEWMIEAGWPDACTIEAFNGLLSLCDRICIDQKNAFKVVEMLKKYGVQPDLFTYNLLISVCRIQGDYLKAFEIFGEMNRSHVVPSVYTYAKLIETCNHRNSGHAHEALFAYRSLLNAGTIAPEHIKTELLSCIENGCEKTDLKGALEIYAKLQAIGLAQTTRSYNAVLNTCGVRGEWIAALDVYACMKNDNVLVNTITFNAIIRACQEAGEVNKALEVFEWMIEGRGNSDRPVPADTETYNILIRACKAAGMLEKALEVFTWMQGAGVDPNNETYDEMMKTVDKARKWDDSIELGASVSELRPAPYDGMRVMYMENFLEKTLDERLAEIKLGEASWAPNHMRCPTAPPSTAPLPPTSIYHFLDADTRPSRGGSRGQQMPRTAPAPATQWGRPQTVKGPYLRGGRVQAPPMARRPHSVFTATAGFNGVPMHKQRPSTMMSAQELGGTMTSLDSKSGFRHTWTPGYRRNAPPLSAKEIVLAREHGVDSGHYRLVQAHR